MSNTDSGDSFIPLSEVQWEMTEIGISLSLDNDDDDDDDWCFTATLVHKVD